MTKNEEIANPNSCFNKAKATELMFIGLERDAATPHMVRQWAFKRVQLGLNNWEDAQIQEALAWANKVEKIQAGLTPKVGHD